MDGLNKACRMLAVLPALNNISFCFQLVNGRWTFVRVMIVSDHEACAVFVPDVASLDVGDRL